FSPNESEYDKRLVFASLAEGQNGMPSKVSLRSYAPRRLNQGRQGSCVGWASAYAARTILQARQTGQSANKLTFSPSYLYNQIAFEGCEGTYLHYAMETMQKQGSLPFSQFDYDEGSCRAQPSSSEKVRAAQYRIKGYERLSVGANNYKVDLNAIRNNLAAGAPVVIGMMVGQSFTQNMMGKRIWQPSASDKRGTSRLGGHAMCVIGYDDTALNGRGAFEIMNSWGERWGDQGVAWVSYPDFEYFVKEAYGLYPMGVANDPNNSKLDVELGLIDLKTRANIALKKAGNNVFRTANPLRVGDKFKVQVTNSIECYTYIFGQETDGSSYVLFPYTEKHSAYCGVTGTRIFPRDYSMVLDDKGTTDWIAILVTKEAKDFETLNRQFNTSTSNSYPGKLTPALRSNLVENVRFNDGGKLVEFKTDVANRDAVLVFIAIDKQ
ncbi:MAG: C1 family peptidase, partial [Bacteroidota bacterium]